MAKQNNNAAAEAVAALQSVYDAAVEELNALAVDATDEDKNAAQVKVDEAKIALDAELAKAAPVSKTKKTKVKFLLSPTGKFSLAYNVGEVASLPELQAVELKEAGFVEFL